METIVEAHSLTKKYPLYPNKRARLLEALDPFRRPRHTDFYALQDISFSVARGECLGVIGVNGSGKSTLLKILTGILSPSGGSVTIKGRIAALLELGAGFHPERTGLDNIYFQGNILGLEKDEVTRFLPNVIEFADIGDFIHQPVKMYSSGMFVRLAFAAAIQGDPEILIVDEALAVGDIAFQFKCMSKIKSMMAAGTTVLFVSHDTASIRNLCQRCLYLSAGRVKALGPAAEISELYAREQRDACNAQTEEVGSTHGLSTQEKMGSSTVTHKVDPLFTQKTIRQGTGDVRFTCVEILKKNGEPLVNASFDQAVTIRLHLEFTRPGHTHIGYHIRNRLNEEILGSGTGFEGLLPLEGNAGDSFAVDFSTRLPLLEGHYSIMAVATLPDGEGQYRFNDMVEHTAFFTVLPRVPVKVWNAVYLPQAVSIHYAGPVTPFKCPMCGEKHEGYLPLWEELLASMEKHGFDPVPMDMEFFNRQALTCPRCGGFDRERICAEYLLRRLGAGFASPTFRFLEFAPNPAFSTFFRKNFAVQHETADLLRKDVDHTLDMTNMPEIATESVDAWISLHMLEHIPDDAAALRELRRILKPGGFGLLLVPLSLAMEHSDEEFDAPVEERWRRFGQDDHVRMYAKKDFVQRVRNAGFTLHELDKSWFGEDTFRTVGLPDKAVLYVVEK